MRKDRIESPTTGGASVGVSLVRIDGKNGYDIKVNHPEANADDYLQALNQAIIELPLDRGRDSRRECCQGCDLCCRERLPLTSIDARVLMAATGVSDLYRWLGRYTLVRVSGRAVDITMARDNDGCALLDSKMRQCRRYEYRPLACQTFLCCPMTRRAEALRDVLINTGEDELVRWWLSESNAERMPPINEGTLVHLSDIKLQPTPYSGKEGYQQVLLKEVCSDELWRELRSDSQGFQKKKNRFRS